MDEEFEELLKEFWKILILLEEFEELLIINKTQDMDEEFEELLKEFKETCNKSVA